MATPEPGRIAANSTCPRCGAAFGCGVLAPARVQAQPCWCMAYPPVASPAPGATCWCPACLEAISNERAGAPAGAAQST